MRSVEILREEMVKLFAEIITMKGHFQGVKPHRNVSICENVQRRAMFFFSLYFACRMALEIIQGHLSAALQWRHGG